MDIFCFEQCRLKTLGKPIDEKKIPEHKSMILSEFCLLQYGMFIHVPPFKKHFCNIAGTPLFRNLILSTILQQQLHVVYEKVMCFNWYFFSLGVFRVRLFLIEKTAIKNTSHIAYSSGWLLLHVIKNIHFSSDILNSESRYAFKEKDRSIQNAQFCIKTNV